MTDKMDFEQGTMLDAIAADTEAQADPAQQPGRKPRRGYTEEEAAGYMDARATKGRKGLSAMRINMAFSPAVYDYIKVMSRVRGESITTFTNTVFERSMAQNRDLYEQAKAFQDTFK